MTQIRTRDLTVVCEFNFSGLPLHQRQKKKKNFYFFGNYENMIVIYNRKKKGFCKKNKEGQCQKNYHNYLKLKVSHIHEIDTFELILISKGLNF
jgi:hypothetical protein